jgi:hypothetical protein
VHDAAGKKMAKVVVGVQAVDEAGKSAATSEREATVEVAADGSATSRRTASPCGRGPTR